MRKRVQLKSGKEIRKFSTFSEEIRLENLTEMDSYVATVVAVNEYGLSIPVEISFNLKGIQNAELLCEGKRKTQKMRIMRKFS